MYHTGVNQYCQKEMKKSHTNILANFSAKAWIMLIHPRKGFQLLSSAFSDRELVCWKKTDLLYHEISYVHFLFGLSRDVQHYTKLPGTKYPLNCPTETK